MAANFAATTAAAHFIPQSQPDPEIDRCLEMATESEKFVAITVSKCFGGSAVVPIRTAFLMSCDDTTEWIMEGKNEDHTKLSLLLEDTGLGGLCATIL